MNRRDFIGAASLWGAGLAASVSQPALAQAAEAARAPGAIVLDPKPLFDISPWLHMQFMEPLGVTDSSVEAAWDYSRDDWRSDFIDTTRDLAPDVVRYGGLFSRYYRWREGTGPASQRPWMRNYVWGGKETNRVGTPEFAAFCRRVNAQALFCVNFLSDGEARYASTPEGNRTGDAAEAAEWVAYANDPGHTGRKAHGAAEPFNIKLWQLGNETSYGGRSTFSMDQSIAATGQFARAMRQRDPSIKLIGWGDNGWAAPLAKQAGDLIDLIAIHMMGQSPLRKDTLLRGNRYQAAPAQAWAELMEMVHARVENKLLETIAALDAIASPLGLAVTEGHLSLAPHNANPILAEWLTGVYHARILNLYQRHGRRVKMAAISDFNGNRWTVNSVLHAVPSGPSYLLPSGAVSRLFKRHNGRQAVAVTAAPSSLDIAASREGSRFFLHVANTGFADATEAAFSIQGLVPASGRVLEISPEDPRQEASPVNPNAFRPREHALAPGPVLRWRFPARSVSVVELQA